MIKRCILLAIVVAFAGVTGSYADGLDGGSGADQHHARLPGGGGGGGDRAMARAPTLGRAGQDATTEAVAHFARSRALLIAALHEFDKGRKIASPSDLLDPVEWRNTLIDRAEDLDRVLDPQPRATKGGIKFEADPRLLPEASK